jgi:8-oxo-dGTP pyrophosphatase MutT (NUDIX family)
MSKPIFINRPNAMHIIDGKEVWISRAPAVCATIFALKGGVTYALGEKRSKHMLDATRKWCVPSGYLDWDENGWDAMTREVYEETGIYLPDNEKYVINNNFRQPWHINTNPSENRQNIAIYYIVVYDFGDVSLPKLDYTDHEIEKLEWIDITKLADYDWAFGHNTRIWQAAAKFNL